MLLFTIHDSRFTIHDSRFPIFVEFFLPRSLTSHEFAKAVTLDALSNHPSLSLFLDLDARKPRWSLSLLLRWLSEHAYAAHQCSFLQLVFPSLPLLPREPRAAWQVLLHRRRRKDRRA